MEPHDQGPDLLGLAMQITAAYARRSQLPANQVASLLQTVHGSLLDLAVRPQKVVAAPLVPAVPIKLSITPDYLICLEDGRKLKTLRRHLRQAFNMTMEEYRARWGLPANYPMSAPNFTKRRQEIAVEIGLGLKRTWTGPRGRRV